MIIRSHAHSRVSKEIREVWEDAREKVSEKTHEQSLSKTSNMDRQLLRQKKSQ